MTGGASRSPAARVDHVVHGKPAVLRSPALDNLRTAMVAWIIGGHALLGYTAIGGWPYDEIHETTLAPRSELAVTAVLGPSALCLIGAFFFVSGLVSEAAVARRGAAGFAAERLVRLGVPFVVFAGLAWPMVMWFAYLAAGHHVSYWWAFVHRTPFLDSGPLWFAEVLLYVSLAYAAWRWTVERAGRRSARPPAALRGGHLVGLALGMVVAAFVVRQWWPARSTQILDLHLWQWPQCVGMFGLGVVAGRRGWRARVPEHLRRGCGWVVVLTLAALPVVALGTGVTNVAVDAEPFLGGWHWQAVILATVESVLTVAASVWLCGTAQHRLLHNGPRPAGWARASYAAFALQAPVLIMSAVVLRPLPWPAGVKAVMVAVLGITVSFWLGGRLQVVSNTMMLAPSGPGQGLHTGKRSE